MALPNFGFLARVRAEEIEAKAGHEADEPEERARALDADEVAARAERRAAARTDLAHAEAERTRQGEVDKA